MIRRLVVALVVAWLGAATFVVVLAARDLASGRDGAERARADLAPERLAGAVSQLEAAEGAFARGSARLRSPLLAPLRVAPVAGRHLRTVEALSRAAREGTSVAAATVRGVLDARDASEGGGPARVVLARTVASLFAAGERDLARLDLGPSEALAPPVAEARDRLARELVELRRVLTRGRDAASAVADLLAGPARLLVLAANNAEMRAGSGMFLQVGVLEVVDGRLALTPPVPTGELRVPVEVPMPEDLEQRWGWLAPNREWRNLGVSPRFDVTAPLAAQMWQALGRGEVDGVLALDAVTLAAVVSATGGVELDGRRLAGDEVVDFVLHDQYLDAEGEGREAHAERRDRLGELAARAVAAVESAGVDELDLAAAIGDAVAGRHLLVWSREPSAQRAWEVLGAAGRLHERSLLVSVLNRGGNKLDPFLDVDVQLSPRRRRASSDVELRVTLRNRVPPGEPRYVAGPNPELPPEVDAVAGEYVGLLSVSLPGDAVDARFDGDRSVPVAGRDGPTQVVATPVRVLPGSEVELVLRFRLSAPGATVEVEPDARVPPASWRAGEQRWAADSRRSIAL